MKFINASALEKDLELRADIVIVGTGAGGAISAEILSQGGFKVILIEEGNFENSSQFDLKELSTFNRLYFEGATRPTKDKAFSIVQGRTVGGSTVVNWTTCIRTPEQTLDYWTNDLKIPGVSGKEMKSWFDWTTTRLNINPWSAHNMNNNLLSIGAEKLGWKHSAIPRNVKNCNALGYCGLGCPIDAKQSMLVTSIPRALKKDTSLVYRARADKFIWKNDRIISLECNALDKDGRNELGVKLKLNADYFISSCGAINSPGLLLRSKIPDPHSMIGKKTFVQLHNYSVAEMPEPVYGFVGAPQSVASDEFLWKDGVTGRAGYNIEAVGAQPIVLMNLRKVIGDELEKYAKSYTKLHVLVSQIRDGFSKDSQGGVVSLNKDHYPILDYPISNFIKDGIKRSYLSMAQCQFASGAHSVVPANFSLKPFYSWEDAKKGIEKMDIDSPDTIVNSTHPLGGCVMGVDPRSSVVDPDAKYHHLKNLSVIDGSIFPTSLGVNPSFSIYSFAAKLASGLSIELRRK